MGQEMKALRSESTDSVLKEFALFGERCSGTNYVEALVTRNFPDLTRLRTYPWEKHSYINVPAAGEKCLAIVVVREPMRWLQSHYRNPHQVGNWRKNASFSEFLRAEWTSVVNGAVIERQRKHGIRRRELMLDRHPMTGKRPRNVLQLRNWKLQSYQKVSEIYQHWVFVRFEDVSSNPEAWVKSLSDDFGLSIDGEVSNVVEDVSRSSGYDRSATKYPDFTPADTSFVFSQLDIEQEKRFGYLEDVDKSCTA